MDPPLFPPETAVKVEEPIIYTSYHAVTCKDPRAINISVGKPAFAPAGYESYPDLFPTRDMLRMSLGQYHAKYMEKLAKLDPYKVIKDLDGRVMCCYEAQGKWCHRHMVAKWLFDTTGLLVPELTFKGPVLVGPGIRDLWEPVPAPVVEKERDLFGA